MLDTIRGYGLRIGLRMLRTLDRMHPALLLTIFAVIFALGPLWSHPFDRNQGRLLFDLLALYLGLERLSHLTSNLLRSWVEVSVHLVKLWIFVFVASTAGWIAGILSRHLHDACVCLLDYIKSHMGRRRMCLILRKIAMVQQEDAETAREVRHRSSLKVSLTDTYNALFETANGLRLPDELIAECGRHLVTSSEVLRDFTVIEDIANKVIGIASNDPKTQALRRFFAIGNNRLTSIAEEQYYRQNTFLVRYFLNIGIPAELAGGLTIKQMSPEQLYLLGIPTKAVFANFVLEHARIQQVNLSFDIKWTRAEISQRSDLPSPGHYEALVISQLKDAFPKLRSVTVDVAPTWRLSLARQYRPVSDPPRVNHNGQIVDYAFVAEWELWSTLRSLIDALRATRLRAAIRMKHHTKRGEQRFSHLMQNGHPFVEVCGADKTAADIATEMVDIPSSFARL